MRAQQANDAAHRLAVYRRLQQRNRLVDILRIGVPALGLVTLAGLVVQIYVASTGNRFGVGRIAGTPDTISIEAPEYAGVLEDGSAYRVRASAAQASIERTDLIELSEADMVVDRVDGVQLRAEAARARLDTTSQQVLVRGIADIADSTGTVGRLVDSVFDWGSQMLTSRGPVAIDYSDGATVRAEGLVYDADAMVWTFSQAVVTLPATPGERLP